MCCSFFGELDADFDFDLNLVVNKDFVFVFVVDGECDTSFGDGGDDFFDCVGGGGTFL